MLARIKETKYQFDSTSGNWKQLRKQAALGKKTKKTYKNLKC